MSIALGSTAASALHVGDTQVARAYLGSDLVLGEAPPAPGNYTTWTRQTSEDFTLALAGSVWGIAGHASLPHIYFARQNGTVAYAVKRSDRTINADAAITIPNKDWRGGTADASHLYLCGNGGGGQIWRIPLDGSAASAIVSNAELANANGVCLAGDTLYIADHGGSAKAYGLDGSRKPSADITLQSSLWDLTSDGAHIWAPGPSGIQAWTVAGDRASSADIGTGQYYGSEVVGDRFYGQSGAATATVRVWRGS